MKRFEFCHGIVLYPVVLNTDGYSYYEITALLTLRVHQLTGSVAVAKHAVITIPVYFYYPSLLNLH